MTSESGKDKKVTRRQGSCPTISWPHRVSFRRPYLGCMRWTCPHLLSVILNQRQEESSFHAPGSASFRASSSSPENPAQNKFSPTEHEHDLCLVEPLVKTVIPASFSSVLILPRGSMISTDINRVFDAKGILGDKPWMESALKSF